jgi:hypothetical protein
VLGTPCLADLCESSNHARRNERCHLVMCRYRLENHGWLQCRSLSAPLFRNPPCAVRLCRPSTSTLKNTHGAVCIRCSASRVDRSRIAPGVNELWPSAFLAYRAQQQQSVIAASAVVADFDCRRCQRECWRVQQIYPLPVARGFPSTSSLASLICRASRPVLERLQGHPGSLQVPHSLKRSIAGAV